MHRVYSNRLPGEERIHVEITRDEIRELLTRPAGPAARAFWGLLATTDHQFAGVTLEDPTSAEPGTGPRCVCGDPIEHWDGPGEPGWIHSPGSDTRCLDARAAARQATGQADTTPRTHGMDPAAILGIHADTDQPDPTTADDPTPLRWGYGDVLHGDDDSIIVCLSGPTREPYWLELDPERAAALRKDLTPEDAPVVGQPAAAPDTDQAHPPRTQWVIEWHRAAKGQWLPDQPPYSHREDAVDEIARQLRHNPARKLRLVRETTTWTVEDETR